MANVNLFPGFQATPGMGRGWRMDDFHNFFNSVIKLQVQG